MKEATLCYVVRGNPVHHVLLGYKKRGFGKNKYVGFGGKIETGETAEIAAVRELEEESSILVPVTELIHAGHLTFVFPARPAWGQVVHAFLARTWHGTPAESEEMKPRWFHVSQIPYDRMWEDTRYFLPLILHDREIRATFTYEADNETVAQVKLQVKMNGRWQ